MSEFDPTAALREELRARVNKLLDRHGKLADSYGRPDKPHLVYDVDGVEMHRDYFGMAVYVGNNPIYTEVRDQKCTSFSAKKAQEVVDKLRKISVLDDLADQG